MVASDIVEIPIGNAANQATIPDQPNLRNQGDQVIVVKSVRLVTANVLSHGPTTGTANMAIADLKKATLVLYANGWEKGKYIPLLTLNDVNNNDSTAATTTPNVGAIPTFDDWENVDWNKSRIQLANGQTTAAAAVVLLQVQYQKFVIVNGQRKLVK